DAVAVGRAAEGLGLQEMAVLHDVDPATGREADGVEAGLGRILEAGKAGKACVPGRALGWRRQFCFCRRDQTEDHAACRQCIELGARIELRTISCHERGALTVDIPLELVTAARLVRRPGRSREKQQQRSDRYSAHGQSTAIMTSEALITTVTLSLALM